QHFASAADGMKVKREPKSGVRHGENLPENRLQRSRAKNMQRCCTAQEIHTVDQPRQSEIMIAVQMADEYILQITPFHAITLHLDLCAFAAIKHDIYSVQRNDLATGVPAIRR